MELSLRYQKLWLLKEPIDFRCGVNRLSELVMSHFQVEIKSGLFIFYNKRKDKVKCLLWHKNGFVLLYKCLEQDRFHFSFKRAQDKMSLDQKQLEWLLAGLDWQAMSNWRELNYDQFS